MGPTPPPLPQSPQGMGQLMGIQQPAPQGPPPQSGLMAYQQPVAAQVASGLDSFMKNFLGSKEAMQQHYQHKVDSLMQSIALGTTNPANLDMSKVASWIKKTPGGEALRTEPYTPQEKEYMAQQKQADMSQKQQEMAVGGATNAWQGAPGGMQQLMQQNAAQANPTVAPPQGPPPGPAPLSMKDKLLGLLGMGRQYAVSAQSPGVQGLQQWAQGAYANAPMNPQKQGQEAQISQLERNIKLVYGVPLQQLDSQTKTSLLQLEQGVLQDDPRALQRATALGITKDTPLGENIAMIEAGTRGQNLPPDEIMRRAGDVTQMGKIGLPMMKMQYDMAEKLIPRFAYVAAQGGDPQAAALSYIRTGQGPAPKFTTDEIKQMADSTAELNKQYPYAPEAWFRGLRMATLAGDQTQISHFSQMIGQTPTTGSIEGKKWSAQYGLDKYRVESEVQNAKDQIGVNTYEAIVKAAGEAAIGPNKIVNDVTLPWEVRVDAMRQIASLGQAMKQVPIPIPGQFNADGSRKMFILPAQAVRGSLNFLQQKWFNVPPHLGPEDGPSSIPGQQQQQGVPPPQGYNRPSQYSAPPTADAPELMDAVNAYIGRKKE